MTENPGLFTERTEKRIKKTGIALLALFTAVFFAAAVFWNVFGGTVWDRGIYALGSGLFLAVFGVMLWEMPIGRLLDGLRRDEARRDAVQIGGFALICLMTLYYYDSGSEYGHSVATRIMNSAFGIVLLALYRREELQKKQAGVLQAVIALLFAGGSFVLQMDEKALVLYALSGMTAWIYGKLLFCFFVRVKEKRIHTSISGYGLLVFALFLGMLCFRNTRTWPFSVAVPFTVLYLHRFEEGGMDRFLRNFCYGCILAFWLMLGAALLFRPYYSFEFVRYPGWFSSVASAGLYWILVFGCGIACLLANIRKDGRLRLQAVWIWLVTLGAAGSYLLMGMSRTSLLGAAGFSAVTFAVAELCYYKDPLRRMLRRILLVVCPVLALFPVVYTLTRCVPALVGRPVWITRAEWFSDRIEKHESISSSKFMNFPQFGESFLEKLFGIDINLSRMAGAVSGPPKDSSLDENGEPILAENEIGYYIADNGQIYTLKDYSFTNEEQDSASNGRFAIFRLYLSQLNLTGHDTMLADPGDTEMELFHAHNSFIQVAFDHGIFVGILFLAVIFGGGAAGVFYYKKNCSKVNFAIYPVIVITSFMITGMTEWVFHPSIPLGFALLIGLTPLIGKSEGK